ncbi:MAG: 50S ribosomal protein L1 [Nanoarchaeota archaeon]|nr:50S ribosomal protein L1 [Nanoarchaeota archaeon]MBU1135177.1 50S ribosomal protein L1 [Nanoarchaeota archaeon]MBU2520530.1 50S ribosomal protein L1 [Nanoarchaeota archaeon]
MAEKEERKEKVVKTLKGQILEKIKEARESSKERKFTQTWDVSVALKGLDLKKPENRFNVELNLPAGKDKKPKMVLIADALAKEGKNYVDFVLTKAELEKLAGNKKKLKSLANEYDLFLGEISLMPLIGKHLGAVLGPRGKSPKPIPPNVKLEPFIEASKKNVRVTLRDNPVVYVSVGSEKMEDEKIATNTEAVINLVKSKLPKGVYNIKAVYIKLTMGKPAKIIVQ